MTELKILPIRLYNVNQSTKTRKVYGSIHEVKGINEKLITLTHVCTTGKGGSKFVDISRPGLFKVIDISPSGKELLSWILFVIYKDDIYDFVLEEDQVEKIAEGLNSNKDINSLIEIIDVQGSKLDLRIL